MGSVPNFLSGLMKNMGSVPNFLGSVPNFLVCSDVGGGWKIWEVSLIFRRMVFVVGFVCSDVGGGWKYGKCP